MKEKNIYYLTQIDFAKQTASSLRVTNICKALSPDNNIRILGVVDMYGAVYRINHSNDQLISNSSDKIKSCSVKVFLKVIERYIHSVNNDKMILFLSVRTLMFFSISSKPSLIYRLIKRLIVEMRMCCMFPITYTRYIYCQIRKG